MHLTLVLRRVVEAFGFADLPKGKSPETSQLENILCYKMFSVAQFFFEKWCFRLSKKSAGWMPWH